MAWLQDVGEPFLSSFWKLGISQSTSKDLLNEMEEFRKKAEVGCSDTVFTVSCHYCISLPVENGHGDRFPA